MSRGRDTASHITGARLIGLEGVDEINVVGSRESDRQCIILQASNRHSLAATTGLVVGRSMMRSINLRRSNSRREVQVTPVNAARSLTSAFRSTTDVKQGRTRLPVPTRRHR